jgi:hypothetical protein
MKEYITENMTEFGQYLTRIVFQMTVLIKAQALCIIAFTLIIDLANYLIKVGRLLERPLGRTKGRDARRILEPAPAERRF